MLRRERQETFRECIDHRPLPPSPTGYLHVGNARTALLNFCLRARPAASSCCASTTPTTSARSRNTKPAIMEDLDWLGIAHDHVRAPVRPRPARISTAAEKLKAPDGSIPVTRPREELDRRRKRQMAARKPPVYDRAALSLSEADNAPSWKPKAASRIGASSFRSAR